MKTLLIFFMMAIAAIASPVTLTWDASPASDAVENYTLVYGTESGKYSAQAVTKTNEVTVDLPRGTWFFAVYATNDDGVNSFLSAEISHKVNRQAPGTPKNLKIPALPIQGSHKGVKWETFATVPLPLDGHGKRYWKYTRIGAIVNL